MTTKENYIKRYNDVRQTVIDAMDEALERTLGNGSPKRRITDYQSRHSRHSRPKLNVSVNPAHSLRRLKEPIGSNKRIL